MNQLVVISGCSGGGKSTLLAELQQRGYPVVEEPGRRIITEEICKGGQTVPWVDMTAFLHRAIEMALADHSNADSTTGWTFFDRGLVDAIAGLTAITGEPLTMDLTQNHRYHQRVFLTPPWPEIYAQDPERRHDMEAALSEYARLVHTYPLLGYEVVQLPKTGVSQRADFVLKTLNG